jgi:hypothetical protein
MSQNQPRQHPLQPAIRRGPAVVRDNPVPPQWPSFTGVSQFVGTSPSGRVTVFFDPTLGASGQQNAQDLVNDADRIFDANNAFFATQGGPVNVIIFALHGATDGTGGADHLGCDFQTGADIEVCASFGNPARVSALFEAELSECCMGGNLCGFSTGEALSRWCAAIVSNNALSDFATAPLWAQDGMPDFVNHTDQDDRNAVSTGCGMAFLSFLISQGHSLAQIAQTMVGLGDLGTLAQLYAQLTSDAPGNAFPKFTAAINALPGGVNTDDPFGAFSRSVQLAHQPGWTAALAGKVFSSIVADITAGKTAHQIVAEVHAILGAAPAKPLQRAAAAACYVGSRALLPPNKAV